MYKNKQPETEKQLTDLEMKLYLVLVEGNQQRRGGYEAKHKHKLTERGDKRTQVKTIH